MFDKNIPKFVPFRKSISHTGHTTSATLRRHDATCMPDTLNKNTNTHIIFFNTYHFLTATIFRERAAKLPYTFIACRAILGSLLDAWFSFWDIKPKIYIIWRYTSNSNKRTTFNDFCCVIVNSSISHELLVRVTIPSEYHPTVNLVQYYTSARNSSLSRLINDSTFPN